MRSARILATFKIASSLNNFDVASVLDATSIPGLLVTFQFFPFDEVALAGSAAYQREVLAICNNLNNGILHIFPRKRRVL